MSLTEKGELKPDPVREIAREVLWQCPVEGGNPRECPLHEVREHPAEIRAEWLDSLSDAKVDKLVVYHWVCCEEKVLRAVDDAERTFPKSAADVA